MGQLASAYEKFANTAIPEIASAVQHHDMRAAFYCGAMTVLIIFENLSDLLNEHTITKADANAEIEAVHQEIKDFIDTLDDANPEQPTVAQPEKEPS